MNTRHSIAAEKESKLARSPTSCAHITAEPEVINTVAWLLHGQFAHKRQMLTGLCGFFWPV